MAKAKKSPNDRKQELTDEVKIQMFKAAIAMAIGNLQRQAALSRRGVPDWRVMQLFRTLIDLGVEMDVLQTPGGSDVLSMIKDALKK